MVQKEEQIDFPALCFSPISLSCWPHSNPSIPLAGPLPGSPLGLQAEEVESCSGLLCGGCAGVLGRPPRHCRWVPSTSEPGCTGNGRAWTVCGSMSGTMASDVHIGLPFRPCSDHRWKTTLLVQLKVGNVENKLQGYVIFNPGTLEAWQLFTWETTI